MKQRKVARETGKTRRTAQVASKRKTVRPVSLPAECVIASAAALRTTLLQRLGDGGTVQLDASAVQRVDAASLQVLAAFAHDRRAGGLALEWLDVPACLAEAAALLDLTNALGLAGPGPSVRA